MASSTLPYIGSKISLISNSEIRYEGVLYTINTEESTVALQNVRSFGTEGRKFPDIPPTSDVYDFIIFRGQDIKDLTVSEAAKPIHNDPAIVSMNVAPPRVNGNSNVVTANGSNNNNVTASPPVMNAFFSQPRENRQSLQMKNERGRVYSYGGSQRGGMQNNIGGGVGAGRMRGMQHGNGGSLNMGGAGFARGGGGGGGGMMGGGSLNHQRAGYNGRSSYGGGRTGGRGGIYKGSRHVIGELHPQPIPSVKDEMAPDFDFDEANAKFEKPGVNGLPPEPPVTSNGGENGAEQLPPPPLGGYNKKASFFDNISCETLDRQQGREEKVNREKQRALDTETFGAIAAQHRGTRIGGFRRGRRGGGRGRGGGGGYMSYAGVRVGGYGERGGVYNSGYAGNIPGGNAYNGRYPGY